MEDINSSLILPLPLPPGFLFRPTSKQLLSFYLFHKNNPNPNPTPTTSSISISHGDFLGCNLIREFELYECDPCDLRHEEAFPFGSNGSKKHWYYFVRKSGGGGGGMRRKGKGGYWQSKGRVRDVMGKGGGKMRVVVGTKREFVYYRGGGEVGLEERRTGWSLIEYALVDVRKDPFVVCRIYLKSGGGSNFAVPLPNCYAEEKTAVVHTNCSNVIYKQYDVDRISRIAEVTVQEDDSEHIGGKVQSRMTTESDPLLARLVSSDGRLGSSLGFPSLDQQIKSSHSFGGNVKFNGHVKNDFVINSTILEGDFIELNDLLFPLLGDDP